MLHIPITRSSKPGWDRCLQIERFGNSWRRSWWSRLVIYRSQGLRILSWRGVSFKCLYAQNEIYEKCHVPLFLSPSPAFDWKSWLWGIVFAVIIGICGEFTPLIIALFGSSFLPGTCITPQQLDNRRRRRMDDLDRKKLPVTPRVTPTVEQVKQLPRRTLIHECRYTLQAKYPG